MGAEFMTETYQSSSCGYGGASEWAKDEKDTEKEEDDDEKAGVAVYPWMTRVHSTNGLEIISSYQSISNWNVRKRYG
ncbi:unnamed protein product [Anisakis simplex]|uniref:Uncharacterized protein n=1 Tax=Anisakis simplex TaxID=6269 RepID=A0A0M3J148_ANISI|nr:unnamed protein product [Anisakis simplex]